MLQSRNSNTDLTGRVLHLLKIVILGVPYSSSASSPTHSSPAEVSPTNTSPIEDNSYEHNLFNSSPLKIVLLRMSDLEQSYSRYFL